MDLFALAMTALHSVDPKRLSTLGIYSPHLAQLLGRELLITADTLALSLQSEKAEIIYDGSAHLCTLCLYTVRLWSLQPTTEEGLREFSKALPDTIGSIDCFVKTHWNPKDL